MTLRLTESLRAKLKKPLGRFVTDVSTLKNKVIISVGDQASKDALAGGLRPLVCVYDGRIGRREVGIPLEIREYPLEELRVKNEPGTLSDGVFSAIERAFGSKGGLKIRVDGEEDLVTLVAVVVTQPTTSGSFGFVPTANL